MKFDEVKLFDVFNRVINEMKVEIHKIHKFEICGVKYLKYLKK